MSTIMRGNLNVQCALLGPALATLRRAISRVKQHDRCPDYVPCLGIQPKTYAGLPLVA
jgi:hypothetical protein